MSTDEQRSGEDEPMETEHLNRLDVSNPNLTEQESIDIGK